MRLRNFVFLLLLLVVAIPLVAVIGLWAIDSGYWRGVISRHVEEATGRKLEIAGPLGISWGLQPTITLEGLKLANAGWAATPTMLEVPRLEVQLRLLSLLGGNPEIDRLSLIDPSLELETAADGRQSWDLRAAAPAAQPPTGDQSSLPVVREATIVNGTIRYRRDDSSQTTTVKVAQARLAGDASGAAATVELKGDVAGTAVEASGRLAQPSALLFGTLAEVGLTDLKARLGETELAGTATLNWAGARPRLRADLDTDRLDPAPFIGLGGSERGKAGRPDGSALDGLTALDADMQLRAGSLVARELKVTRLEARAKLEAGRLEIAPLDFQLYGRPVHGSLLLDGGRHPAEVGLNAAADAVEIGHVLAGLGAVKLIEGQGDVRAELRGHGATPHDWAATAAGHIRLLMNGGQLSSQLVARLAGGLRQLAGSLGGGQGGDVTSIRCALVDVPVDEGVARPDLILDTDYVTLIAHGTVDLGHDRIDLTLSPHAKSVDLNVALPVTIRGPLENPSYGIDETDAARRLVSLLGSTIFPPAALGAFVDFGSAKGNDCLRTAASPPPTEHATQPTPAESLGEQIEGAAKRLLDQLLPAK